MTTSIQWMVSAGLRWGQGAGQELEAEEGACAPFVGEEP